MLAGVSSAAIAAVSGKLVAVARLNVYTHVDQTYLGQSGLRVAQNTFVEFPRLEPQWVWMHDDDVDEANSHTNRMTLQTLPGRPQAHEVS